MKMPVSRLAAIAMTWIVLLAVRTAPLGAQELEPRAYRPLPVGLNFAVLSYQVSSGNVLGDPTAPVQNLDLTSQTAIFGYLRTLSVFGRSASVAFMVPYVFMSGSATFQGEDISDSRSGAADSRFQIAVNLLGGPAMTPREFAAFRQGRSLGASLTVVPPTGQYDPTRLVNFGTNRWAFKPEIGYSSLRGNWYLEGAVGVWFFTDNTDFFGGHTRTQNPIGNVQGDVTYNFKNGIWAAFAANYFTGGRTTIDGGEQADLQRNSRVGLTLSLPLGGPHSLKIAASRGAYTSAGADFSVLALTYMRVW